ncbi:hypothetical protein GCM10017562_39140 [Streptomyces roseofulvus]
MRTGSGIRTCASRWQTPSHSTAPRSSASPSNPYPAAISATGPGSASDASGAGGGASGAGLADAGGADAGGVGAGLADAGVAGAGVTEEGAAGAGLAGAGVAEAGASGVDTGGSGVVGCCSGSLMRHPNVAYVTFCTSIPSVPRGCAGSRSPGRLSV